MLSSRVAGRPFREELVDGLAQAVGDAELAAHCVGDETAELLDDRIVEPQLLPQAVPLGVRRVLPDQVGDRIAHELEQGERDDRDHEHDHHGLKQAAGNEGKHGLGAPADSRAVYPRPGAGAAESFRNAPTGADPGER